MIHHKSTKLLKGFMSLLTEKATIKANHKLDKNGKETSEHYGKEISDLFKETQIYIDNNTLLSPYNPPHGMYSDCCGIFNSVNKDNIVCCNECGMTIIELIDTIENELLNKIANLEKQLK